MGERHKAEVEWLRREIDLSVDLRERIEEENERLGAEVEWLRSAVEGLQRAAESDRLRIARLLDELGDKHAEVERLRTDLAASRSAADTLAGARDRLYVEVEQLREAYRVLLTAQTDHQEAALSAYLSSSIAGKRTIDAAIAYMADAAKRADDHAREVERDG